jgi:hypothetical protein
MHGSSRLTNVVFAVLASVGLVLGGAGCSGSSIKEPGNGRSSSDLGASAGGGGSTTGGSGKSGGGEASAEAGSGCSGPGKLVCSSGEEVCDEPGSDGYCTQECRKGPCPEIACKAPPPPPPCPPPPPLCCPIDWTEGSDGFCCPPSGIEAPCFKPDPKCVPPPPTCGSITCAANEICCEGVPFSEPTCISGEECPI